MINEHNMRIWFGINNKFNRALVSVNLVISSYNENKRFSIDILN